MSLIVSTLQSFFTDRLVKQRRASPRTIAAYRDSLRLLVVFVHRTTGKTPAASTGTTSTPRRSARSWTISKPSATTARGPATCG